MKTLPFIYSRYFLSFSLLKMVYLMTLCSSLAGSTVTERSFYLTCFVPPPDVSGSFGFCIHPTVITNRFSAPLDKPLKYALALQEFLLGYSLLLDRWETDFPVFSNSDPTSTFDTRAETVDSMKYFEFCYNRLMEHKREVYFFPRSSYPYVCETKAFPASGLTLVRHVKILDAVCKIAHTGSSKLDNPAILQRWDSILRICESNLLLSSPEKLSSIHALPGRWKQICLVLNECHRESPKDFLDRDNRWSIEFHSCNSWGNYVAFKVKVFGEAKNEDILDSIEDIWHDTTNIQLIEIKPK